MENRTKSTVFILDKKKKLTLLPQLKFSCRLREGQAQNGLKSGVCVCAEPFHLYVCGHFRVCMCEKV